MGVPGAVVHGPKPAKSALPEDIFDADFDCRAVIEICAKQRPELPIGPLTSLPVAHRPTLNTLGLALYRRLPTAVTIAGESIVILKSRSVL